PGWNGYRNSLAVAGATLAIADTPRALRCVAEPFALNPLLTPASVPRVTAQISAAYLATCAITHVYSMKALKPPADLSSLRRSQEDEDGILAFVSNPMRRASGVNQVQTVPGFDAAVSRTCL